MKRTLSKACSLHEVTHSNTETHYFYCRHQLSCLTSMKHEVDRFEEASVEKAFFEAVNDDDNDEWPWALGNQSDGGKKKGFTMPQR